MKDTSNAFFVYKRAEFNRQDNNHPEAIKLYTESINEYTQYFGYVFDVPLERCYLGRCKSYLEIGDYEKAAEDCAEIVKHNLLNPDAWLCYGIASYYLKEYRKSLEYLKYSKELSPDPTFAFTWIANVNYKIGEYQEAKLNVNKALQRNPNDEWAMELLETITKAMDNTRKALGPNSDISTYVDIFKRNFKVLSGPLLGFSTKQTALPIERLTFLSWELSQIKQQLVKCQISDDEKYLVMSFKNSILVWDLVEDKKQGDYESETDLMDFAFLNNEEIIVLDTKYKIMRANFSKNHGFKTTTLGVIEGLHFWFDLDINFDKNTLLLNQYRSDRTTLLLDIDKFKYKELGASLPFQYACCFAKEPSTVIYSGSDWISDSKGRYTKSKVVIFDYANNIEISEYKVRSAYDRQILSHSKERNAFALWTCHQCYWDDGDYTATHASVDYLNLDAKDQNFSAEMWIHGDYFAKYTGIIDIGSGDSQIFFTFGEDESSSMLLGICDVKNRSITFHKLPTGKPVVKFPNSSKFILFRSKEVFVINLK